MNARRLIGCMGVAVILATPILATPPAIAQTTADRYAKHSCAVVKITAADGTVGNGFFADANGLLVTSAQVIFQHSFFKTEAGIGVDIRSKGPITLLSDDGRQTTVPSPPVNLHHADNATRDLAAIDTGLATPCFIPMASAAHLRVGDSLTLVVAIFGTTISPYLFFWQSSEEVEEEEADPAAGPLIDHPEQAPRELTRIGWETWLGMGFSNLVAFFIILTTAVTLNASGQTDIQTSEQAAAALKPIAGAWSFMLFSLGIIGTGLLAIPVLAGSAGYAVGEIRGWRTGLERTPREAVPFYAVIAAGIVLGVGIDFTPLDPIKALFWSAVLNGVITVPIIAAMLIVASRPQQMGAFVATPGQRILGWTTTAVMAAAAAVAMFALM